MKDNYEVISYNKDFLTGKTVTSIKSKKRSGIRGKVTISLFNAMTGEKTVEAYTENLIPDVFFKEAFLGQFVAGIMGAGYGSRTSNAYSWFDYIYLTDSDKPESAMEQRVDGNVIGYAHRNTTYSGDSSQNGTINKAETTFEVSGNKIRLNFVFDFPTHAANGVIESIYFCQAAPSAKDYFYMGAPYYGRVSGDNDISVYAGSNPRRYYGLTNSFSNARFLSPTSGYTFLDGKSSGYTQSSYLEFPANLKGHWIYFPFDVNVNDVFLWDQAVRLLNSDGDPLVAVPSDPEKAHDGLQFVCPYTGDDGVQMLIGYYNYNQYVSSVAYYYLHIYTWSKVGVQQHCVDIDLTRTLKDEYGSLFNVTGIRGEGVFIDGCIDVVGYNERIDEATKEKQYTSRWVKVNAAGEVVQNMEIKPKIGNCVWFSSMGMNSGNIERRCYVSSIWRTKSRVYLLYTGTQGGRSFYQCLSYGGNLIEPYRSAFGVNDQYFSVFNILGTDRWISKYNNSRSEYQACALHNALTSKPIGTHTRLTQPVEKTESNTMKVQYLFEADLPVYSEDYF